MPNPSLLILPGDGIGPEVMAEVRKVIDWFGSARGAAPGVGSAYGVKEIIAGVAPAGAVTN